LNDKLTVLFELRQARHIRSHLKKKLHQIMKVKMLSTFTVANK